MHLKAHYDTRARSAITVTILVCCIVPLIGFLLCNSHTFVSYETHLLVRLSNRPQWLYDCSAIFALLFSTGGCVLLLAIIACINFRFAHSIRTVLGDVAVAASPIVYVTGIKWLVERPRPVTALHSNLLPTDPSFPSGHTAGAVIVATMIILTVRNAAHCRMRKIEELRRHMGVAPATCRNGGTAGNIEAVYTRRAMVTGIILVVAVGISRLLLGLHFPTDVLTSAIVCPLISYTVWIIREQLRAAKARQNNE